MGGMLESYGELLPQHYTKGGKPGYYPPIKGARPELVLNLYDPFNFSDKMTDEAKEAGLRKEINNGRLAMLPSSRSSARRASRARSPRSAASSRRTRATS